MKTTLGVGITVLSALAAQGKNFDRTELNAMLDRLAASPEPKAKTGPMAKCYSMAVPERESFDYVCKKCGKRTVCGQEIVVRENRFSTVRFGKCLGPDVLDYFRASHSSRFGYVMLLALLVLWPVMIFVRQMHIDKAFHGIYTTGGGLGTKMGIYVKESDYEQARPIAERIMQRVG